MKIGDHEHGGDKDSTNEDQQQSDRAGRYREVVIAVLDQDFRSGSRELQFAAIEHGTVMVTQHV